MQGMLVDGAPPVPVVPIVPALPVPPLPVPPLPTPPVPAPTLDEPEAPPDALTGSPPLPRLPPLPETPPELPGAGPEVRVGAHEIATSATMHTSPCKSFWSGAWEQPCIMNLSLTSGPEGET